MSPPLELDYVGLAQFSPADKLSSGIGENLRETELRLGLPGSESPNRKEKLGLTLGPQLPKGYASGAKRGFSDAIDGSKKWGFSVSGGSDTEMEKGGAFFSPRAGGVQATVAGNVTVGQEKKPQGPPNAKNYNSCMRKLVAAANCWTFSGCFLAISSILGRAQVVGWPPIRSYRKNTMAANPSKNEEDVERKQGPGCLYIKVSMDGAPYLRKVDLRNYCSYKELSSALEKMFSGFTMGRCGANGIPSRDGLSERCLMDLLSGSECVLTYEDKDGDWMLVGDVPWEMFIDSCKRLRIMKGSDAIGLAPRVMEKNRNRK